MTLYLVTKNMPTIEECLCNVITVLPKEKYALPYIYGHITRTKQDHYTNWCALHNMDENLTSTVREYVNTCWYDEITNYAVVKERYNKENIAKMLRMLSCSLPVGGEWEFEDEVENYIEFQERCKEYDEAVAQKQE